MNKSQVKYRLLSMTPKLLSEEMDNYPLVLLDYYKNGFLSLSYLRSLFYNQYLSTLATFIRCNKNYKSIIHPIPILDSLPFPTDVSLHIFSFL